MSDSGISAPTHLSDEHSLEQFDCGNPILNDWLKRQARKNERNGASRTYVVSSGARVVGYYCLTMGAVVRSESPKPMQRNMPDHIPVVLLGRMAVDHSVSGRGMGSALLKDAALRGYQLSVSIGVKAILVHAISEELKQ